MPHTAIPPALLLKAKPIRLCIFDVDGVLTSGLIYYTNQSLELRSFHVHDGLGIQLLQRSGLQVAIISAKNSETVAKRLKDLKIEHVYLGQESKLPAYETLKQKLQVADEAISYMGDDLPDLPLLRRAGLAITVPHAPALLKQQADFVTTRKAGKGAVREVCELVLHAQDRYSSIIQSYLNE